MQPDSNPGLGTTHEVLVSSLLACTTYHYRIIGVDEDGYVYTGSDSTFTTECANSSPVLTSKEQPIEIPAGGLFSMTSNIGTILELIIPVDIVSSIPELIFQGKQLAAGAVL